MHACKCKFTFCPSCIAHREKKKKKKKKKTTRSCHFVSSGSPPSNVPDKGVLCTSKKMRYTTPPSRINDNLQQTFWHRVALSSWITFWRSFQTGLPEIQKFAHHDRLRRRRHDSGWPHPALSVTCCDLRWDTPAGVLRVFVGVSRFIRRLTRVWARC